jgi:hypothetical protein
MLKINTHLKNRDTINESVPSGFTMIFSNGNTISVQFGFGNYCENTHESKMISSDAEIAIWDKHGHWYNFGSDDVKGHCSADEVAKWIQFAATTADFHKPLPLKK